jgi:hypothetical protein
LAQPDPKQKILYGVLNATNLVAVGWQKFEQLVDGDDQGNDEEGANGKDGQKSQNKCQSIGCFLLSQPVEERASTNDNDPGQQYGHQDA